MMESTDLLRVIWYVIIGALFAGYTLLDGFDLGIGSLMPVLAKTDQEKKDLYSTIAPVWDGNGVWLITAGAALFAAFPQVYATVFSGFYLAFMLVLFALIFRAVSWEFWTLDEKRRAFWNWTFVLGSFLPSLIYGIALGNVIVGIPLDAGRNFTGNFLTLFRPYPVVIGLLGLVVILMQGVMYAAARTAGVVQLRAAKAGRLLHALFIFLFILSAVLTDIYLPRGMESLLGWALVAIVLIAWIMNLVNLNKGRYLTCFYASSLTVLALWGLVGTVQFPNLVRASGATAYSLTLRNASSGQTTLLLMLVIAVVGMPIVIAYTAYLYKVFQRGPSSEGENYSKDS